MLAEQLLRAEAGQPLDRVGQEREPRVGADRPDEVRRVLDEVAVALLRLAQLALEPGALDYVADRALGADPAAVLEDAGRRDLGGEGRAVAADQGRAGTRSTRSGVAPDRRVLLDRDRHRLGVGQEARSARR